MVRGAQNENHPQGIPNAQGQSPRSVNPDPRRAIAGPKHHIYHKGTACSTVSLPGRGFIVSDSLSQTPVPSPPLGTEPASEPEARGASPRRGRLLLRLLLLTALTTALVWFWDPLIIQYRQARARMSLDKRREAETLDSLRAALRRDLDNPHTLLWLARTHRRLGDLPRTSLLLDRAETLGGDARRIELERRLVLAQSGRLGEVEPLLPDMLIDAGADGPDVCEAFVQGFFVNLRTAEALRLLDLWQESFPKDPQPYFMRAYLMRSLDKYTEAEQIYRQGLALAPDRTAMRRELADILVVTNQLDQAESELSAMPAGGPGRSPGLLWVSALRLPARQSCRGPATAGGDAATSAGSLRGPSFAGTAQARRGTGRGGAPGSRSGGRRAAV